MLHCEFESFTVDMSVDRLLIMYESLQIIFFVCFQKCSATIAFGKCKRKWLANELYVFEFVRVLASNILVYNFIIHSPKEWGLTWLMFDT